MVTVKLSAVIRAASGFIGMIPDSSNISRNLSIFASSSFTLDDVALACWVSSDIVEAEWLYCSAARDLWIMYKLIQMVIEFPHFQVYPGHVLVRSGLFKRDLVK